MPLRVFDIDASVVGDTVVVERVGFIIDAISVTRAPAGVDVDLIIGANQPVAVEIPVVVDGIEYRYDQDSRLGFTLRNNVAQVGRIEGAVSYQLEALPHNAGGIKVGGF